MTPLELEAGINLFLERVKMYDDPDYIALGRPLDRIIQERCNEFESFVKQVTETFGAIDDEEDEERIRQIVLLFSNIHGD